MKNSDNYVILFLIVIVIILGLILFMKSGGFFGTKQESTTKTTTDESNSAIKTDVEISSIKERISTIATTLGIGSEISNENTYRNLINNKLSQSTKYQIDTDFDVTQNGKKITNKDNITLHVTINTEGAVSASFNI